MTAHSSRPVPLLVGAMALLLAGAAPAQAQEATPRIYRCGDSYGSTPCPGGKPVPVDDSRSEAQRREAEALKIREAKLAGELAAERQARERAAVGQLPSRIGPTEAERAEAEAKAAHEKAKAERAAKKKVSGKKPRHHPRPAVRD